MANIEIDDKEFQKRLTEIAGKKLEEAKQQKVHDIASEILRLSSKMVPFDKGMLLNSGNVIDQPTFSVVGYNKVYASRLHEHPEYKFKNGRSGKYLETPIKINMGVFKQYFADIIINTLTT